MASGHFSFGISAQAMNAMTCAAVDGGRPSVPRVPMACALTCSRKSPPYPHHASCLSLYNVWGWDGLATRPSARKHRERRVSWPTSQIDAVSHHGCLVL